MKKILLASLIGCIGIVGFCFAASSTPKAQVQTTTESVNQQQTERINTRELVIAQMNYSITALTNIINAPSMEVYVHERNQLINNLTITEVVGFDEVMHFRQTLLQSLSQLEITEEERNLLRHVQDMKKDNRVWTAVSNGLSQPMFFLGNPKEMIAQGFLAATRTYVDYNVAQNEQKIDELTAMWELRKKDMEVYAQLRIQALELVYNLYKRYGLQEQDRLTEETANRFNRILLEENLDKRIRLLQDNATSYAHFPDYHYYLGMAYLDKGNYPTAKQYFDQYTTLYSKAPIFRVDEKLGVIALAQLTYEDSLSVEQTLEQIECVKKNLPTNGAAWAQCALSYLHLQDKASALNTLSKALDDFDMLDKDILAYTAIQILPITKECTKEQSNIIAALQSQTDLSWGVYVLLQATLDTKHMWEKIKTTIDVDYSDEIRIDPKFTFDLAQCRAYKTKMNEDELSIDEFTLKYEGSKKKENILSDVQVLEDNPELLGLFFTQADSQNEMYRVRQSVDFKRLLSRDLEYPLYTNLMGRIPNLSDNDLEELVQYCTDLKEDDKGVISLSTSWWYSISQDYPISTLDYIATPSKKGTIIDITSFNPKNNKSQIDFDYDGEEELTFIPKFYKGEDALYNQINYIGKVPFVLTYDSDNQIYSLEINGKLYYRTGVNIPEEPETEETSWWDTILSWFS